MTGAGVITDENERLQQLAMLDKRRLPADGGPRFNRLIFAASPYLLQHAENPVDWYQWGEEAFARARAEDKPVFLSIGYATCHWCHVMAHESFEDREVAEELNRHFIAIKVDREERPDIDAQYMAVAQLLSGSGGWPLNIIMTADKRPFFAATYLPKTPRMGMPGIIELLGKIVSFWGSQRQQVEENCAAIMASLTERNSPAQASAEVTDLEEKAFQQLSAMYDDAWGGFGGAPKFPMPHYISFLLRFWKRSGRHQALQMVDKTLTMMRSGGIYDQLGFGFHRYAVDRHWLVPHFEKMLYDQALLVIAHVDAFQATADNAFRDVVREILTFVLREMALPDGGFCSAQDADSEGEEGKYYLWTPAEITAVLGEASAPILCRLFDVTERGNFEGRNILHLPTAMEEFAGREGCTVEFLQAELKRWRSLLLPVREKRIRPLRDGKALTAWNGLMIAALVKAYGICGEERFLAAAKRAATFVLGRMQTPQGRLLRSYHLDSATIPAFLEDYAFFVWGLLELHQVTLESGYLDDALRLSREMLRLFAGEEGDGLYESGIDGEEVLIRQKSAYDGVIPSGNSVASMNLLRLGRICSEPSLEEAGKRVLHAFMGNVERQPVAYLQLLMAYDYLHAPAVEVTFTGDKNGPELGIMLAALQKRFILGLVVRYGGEAGQGAEGRGAKGVAAHLCANGACQLPVQDVKELERLVDSLEFSP